MKIVVLTGAGISAESGIKTFRDSDGLWEGHDVMEVASPQGWEANRELVSEFYNLRRAQLLEVEPNAAHKAFADLEKDFRVKNRYTKRRRSSRKSRKYFGSSLTRRVIEST